MSSLKKKKGYSIAPYIQSRNLSTIEEKSGNIYESISVIGSRSKQIGLQLKDELRAKLDEFASSTDSLEEIHENKEQIEISKYYERLPHPTLLALEEFMEDKIYYRNNYREKQNKKNS